MEGFSSASTDNITMDNHYCRQEVPSAVNVIRVTPMRSSGVGRQVGFAFLQFFVGMITCVFAGILTIEFQSVSHDFAIHFWAMAIYFCSFGVAGFAQNSPSMMKCSLAMGVLTSIIALVAIILYIRILSAPRDVFNCPPLYPSFLCKMPETWKPVVILALSILKFIVSMCLSVSAYKAASSTSAEVFGMQTTNQPAISSVSSPFPVSNVSQPVMTPYVHTDTGRNYDDMPPPYSSIQDLPKPLQ